MEPFCNLLNYLNAMEPRLEGNTLHVSALLCVQRHHVDIMTDVLYRVRFPIVGVEW